MDYRKEFRIDPDTKFKLHKLDPAFTDKHEGPDEAKKETEVFAQKLFRQQALLHAEHKHSILVVLQALDAGGKDGTIKHVFAALNPQGVSVAAFKQPTSAELAHDFLWRVHPHAPGEGEIVIFNRSHYEDVLVTRVHKLIDKATWTARYQLIRSAGFHRPIMRVATSGDRRRPFKNAPVKLTRPVRKTVPADLRKIPAQCRDIGVGADAVEPFEHDRHILALLASRGDWDFLMVDRAACSVREDFCLLLAG